ncbi:uncharacterized protein KY384_007253 [Bacidia gigantensis]|uniref:uncharacterized protein n=1 Tax=Bacidia gigantensis TaxID=2732470 RepID=UPI001D0418EC|nr:uncharacterized protein KY384_007253 [Bacidia gigantensis]KAG8528335.1 hypothetical protein KY384_007253 [Bacidia gigantensis]
MFGRKQVPEAQRQPSSQPPSRSPYSRLPPDNADRYGGGSYGRPQPSSQPQSYNPPPSEKHDSSRGHARTASRSRSWQLQPTKSPKPQFHFYNMVPVSPFDFPLEQFNPQGFYIAINDFVFTAKQDEGFQQGYVGLSDFQRSWAGIALSDTLFVTPFDPFQEGQHHFLGSLDAEISFAGRRETDVPFDQDELQTAFTRMYENQVLAPGERILMDWKSLPILLVVKAVQLTDLSMNKQSAGAQPTTSDPRVRGILTNQSQMGFFKDPKSKVNLKASKKRAAGNAILTPDFKFEDMGIGGLDKEFSAIFRRAFASRIFPPGLIEAMGIQHVKGILLFGPPGTGKTLIARRIGKMLNAREPKVINGPEVLNKFVGQSEENVRKLFADAEKEYKEKGDESGLHIIIFDELDAVCKQRGSGAGGGTGVGDSVVNQLLSKLDGVDQLNNILLIGMTNRLDMIDDALLRPGRLEVHMEISLPDESGRVQILKIHTAKMRDSGNLDRDVDLVELAARTKNFSGAEISGLVRSATSFALQRHVKVGTMAGVSDDLDTLTVNLDDFEHAFEDVKPAFGVAEDEMETLFRGGIIQFSPFINDIVDAGRLIVKQVQDQDSAPRFRALLWGPPGSGKTALAAKLALDSSFPFIKLITPDNMIGFSETMKTNHMRQIFEDAYKSPLSIVLIDNIESIIEWVRIGPRFSNPVLQALKAMLNKQPPKNHRLLVLATATERHVLQELNLYQSFDQKIAVPTVNSHEELEFILEQSHVFKNPTAATKELREITRSDSVGVGIKSILLAIDTAKQDDDREGRLASTLASLKSEAEYL